MRVIAKTNISRNSGWVFAGTEFDIRKDELTELTGLIEVMGEADTPMTEAGKTEAPAEITETAATEAEAPVETPVEAKPARNSRKRKQETV